MVQKSIIIIFLTFTFLINFLFAQNNNSILKKLNIPENILNSTKAISRYEIIEILNLADCFICKNPAFYEKKLLNGKRWNKFKTLPSSNFDDIYYPKTIYKGKNYYYCVAYGAKKQYIHGFPRQISPICPGKYCGEKLTTISDFFQIVFNILSDKIYQNYQVNWSKIKKRVFSLNQFDKKFLYFNLIDLQAINEGFNQCGNNICNITNKQQFIAYIKYCTFNLKECNMQPIGNLNQGDWPIAELNILIKEGIFEKKFLENINFNYFVPQGLVYKTFLKLKQKNNCKFDFDYDKDGILNNQDNCPNTYNPNQNDLDKDGIGDVCDDDIDGDGIKNPIGIVDWKGNIVYEKIYEWKKLGKYIDNCIFTPNTNQKDLNKNNIGDACEAGKIKAIYIQAKPLEAFVGDQINFKATIKGQIKNIKWDFGDFSRNTFGKTTKHIYKKAGKYIVKATAYFQDNTKKTAYLTIKISDKIKNNIGFQISCNPLIGNKPLKTSCKASFKGEIDKIKWILDKNDIRFLKPNSNVSKTFYQVGKYPILAIAYKNGKPIASSQLNVFVTDKYKLQQYASQLKADKLQLYTNQPLNLTTIVKGFTQKDINYILWDFGDGYKEKNNKLNLTYYFTTPGPKKISQTIILKNGNILKNHLIVDIKQYINGKGTYLKAKPLIQKVGKDINFNLITKNIPIQDIYSIKWDFGDGNQKLFTQNISKSFNQKHFYTKPGIYEVKTILSTKEKSFISKAIVYIIGTDICNIKNIDKLKCDMDKDGIPDICDTDIDGDGFKNFIGILKYERKDCKITKDNINYNILNIQRNLIQNFYKNEIFYPKIDIDNCPFNLNPNQEDIDLNAIGDKCEKTIQKTKFILNTSSLKAGGGFLDIPTNIVNKIKSNILQNKYLGR